MTEQRPTHPTASQMDRLARCPGSWKLSQQIPQPEDTPEAASGTRIHAALAGEDVELTEDEERVKAACARLAQEIIAEWKREKGIVLPRLSREQRLELEDVGFSGKPDLVLEAKRVALVIDYKTGRIPVPPIDRNWQMRSVAMLAGYRLPADEVTVAIVQPLCSPQVELCVYDDDAIHKAYNGIELVLRDIKANDAHIKPGEIQCAYCPAKAICVSAHKMVRKMGLAKTDSLGSYPIQEFAALLDYCSLAEKYIDAIRAEAKRRLTAGEDVPGWGLKEGHVRQTITDIELVHARCYELGIPSSRFAERCTISKKALTELLREEGKQKQIGAVLEGAVEEKQTAPRLERVRGKNE